MKSIEIPSLRQRSLVGIIPQRLLSRSRQLKQLLLIFDRLAVTLSDEDLEFLEADNENGPDLTYLRGLGLLNPSMIHFHEVFKDWEAERAGQDVNLSVAATEWPQAIINFASVLAGGGSVQVAHRLLSDRVSLAYRRLEAAYLRSTDGSLDAVPVLGSLPSSVDDFQTKRFEVLHLVLSALPIPGDSTSWEQVLEFRKDADARYKHLALRNFVNELAQSPLSAAEIEDKLAWLTEDFRHQMAIHRMKTTWYELLVVTTAEVIESLVKMQFGKAARSLFVIRKAKINLLEEEATAAGRELSYIVKCQEHF